MLEAVCEVCFLKIRRTFFLKVCFFVDFAISVPAISRHFHVRLLYLLSQPALVFLSCQLLRVVSPVALMAAPVDLSDFMGRSTI